MKKISVLWFKLLSWLFWPKWEYFHHYAYISPEDVGIKIILKDDRSERSKIIKVPGSIAPLFGSLIQKGYMTYFKTSSGKELTYSVSINCKAGVSQKDVDEVFECVRRGGLTFDFEYEQPKESNTEAKI